MAAETVRAVENRRGAGVGAAPLPLLSLPFWRSAKVATAYSK
jgi:hypothetical protein